MTNNPTLPTPGPESGWEQRRPVHSNLLSGLSVLCLAEEPSYTHSEVLPDLERAGFDVEMIALAHHTGEDIKAQSYNMVIMDLNSADGYAYGLCSKLRATSRTPLVMILHGQARANTLRGYESGADACLLAPFDPRELVARLAAILWRTAYRTPPA